MVIFSGEMTEGDFEKELAEFRKMLQESTQGITYEDLWGRQTFAFRVKKQWRGYYVVFNFAAPTAGIVELRTNVKLNPHVLRHLLLTVPDDYIPDRYKTETLPEKIQEERRRYEKKPPAAVEIKVEGEAAVPAPVKATVAGKEEEEQLKSVEKKLEKILENPDINIS